MTDYDSCAYNDLENDIPPGCLTEGKLAAENDKTTPEGVQAFGVSNTYTNTSCESIFDDSAEAVKQKISGKDESEKSQPNLISMTLMTAPPGRNISKGYELGPDGRLAKVPAASFSYGAYQTATLSSLADFPSMLVNLGPHQALLYGICEKQPSGRIVPEAKRDAKKPKDVSRTKIFFKHPKGLAIVAIDIDAPKDGAPLTRDEAIAALKTFPGFGNTSVVWAASASSYIYNAETDEELRGLTGQRFYFVVACGTDIQRLIKLMHARMFLTGFGYYEISESGSLLERSPVDCAMQSPTQPDFVGGIVPGKGVEQRRRPPELLWDGPPSDSRLEFPDLTPEEQQQYDTMRAAERERLKPEAARQRAIWKARRIAAMVPGILKEKGIKAASVDDLARAEAEAGAILETALDTSALVGDFVIMFDDGTTATVREILKEPAKYHGRLTRDPLEWNYDGGRVVGKLYLDGNNFYLHSAAHGGKTYRLLLESVPPGNVKSTKSAKGFKKMPNFPATDLGNARRFVSQFGDDIHYCPEFKSFLTWEGQAWHVDGDGAVMRLGKKLADQMLSTAKLKAAKQHALKTQSQARLNALLDLTKSEPGIPVSSEKLDGDPWLFAVANGVVDLRTGTLRPAVRDDLITKQSSVVFDPNAQCDVFLDFLCVFQAKLDTDSTANWTAIPRQSGQ